MGECIYYQYKEGDYHCSRANHDIGDPEHLRRYCWGSCEDCPIYQGEESAEQRRGTDECIFYCFRDGDYYCRKDCRYLDSGTVHSLCWDRYRSCPAYTGQTDAPSPSAPGEEPEAAPAPPSGRAGENPAGEQTARRQEREHTRQAETSGGPDAPEAMGLLLSILGLALLNFGRLLWRLARTLPFWGPSAFILLLPALMVASPAAGGAAAVPVLGIVLVLSAPLYLFLHLVLIRKCRKRPGKNRFAPVCIDFLLFVLFLPVLPFLPAAYQIWWLVREKKQRGGAGI